jgi:hypothetical protein
VYRRLIELAVNRASFAYVVVRAEGVGASGVLGGLEILRPEEIGQRSVTEWPGTRLLGAETAMLVQYRCSARLASLLRSVTTGLYDWVHPRLPEDLGFLRADESVWLASIAHERDAFMKMSDDEWNELADQHTDIAGLLKASMLE